MGEQKVMTIRLPMDLYEELELVARADGLTVSAEIRLAIDAYVEHRKDTAEFRKRLTMRIEADQLILERLKTS